MFKLVKNELKKVFRKELVYVLIFLTILFIVKANQTNFGLPYYNSYGEKMDDIPIYYEDVLEEQELASKVEEAKKNPENIEKLRYVVSKIGGLGNIPNTVEELKLLAENTEGFDNVPDNAEEIIEIGHDIYLYLNYYGTVSENLYNSFYNDDWQRFALNEDGNMHFGTNYKSFCNMNVYRKTIIDFEVNPVTMVTQEEYEKAKDLYNQYENALKTDNWKEYVNIKIKCLEERKQQQGISDEEIEGIDFELELYKLRLQNDINYGDSILNDYIENCVDSYYTMKFYQNDNDLYTEAYNNSNINCQKALMNISKYAIENNINREIFSYSRDARGTLIDTFEHFDWIIILFALYISITIAENKEVSKEQKKNKILISKILASISFIAIVVIIIILTQVIAGGVEFGFDSYTLDYIGFNHNQEQVFTMNLFAYILLVALTKLPMYIIAILFGIFIGVDKHTLITSLITIVIFIEIAIKCGDWMISNPEAMFAKFFITNNWDFSKYLFGKIPETGISLLGAIAIYLIYAMLLIDLTRRIFNKKKIN